MINPEIQTTDDRRTGFSAGRWTVVSRLRTTMNWPSGTSAGIAAQDSIIVATASFTIVATASFTTAASFTVARISRVAGCAGVGMDC
jgi:hypothetical protein